METEHFIGKVSLRALIERDDQVFVCRGIGDIVWQLPGGRMNIGEEPKEGLAREISEELGITIHIIRPLFSQTFVHMRDRVPQLLLVYLCSMGQQEMIIDSAETEESKWLFREELKNLQMYEDCRNAVDEFLKDK